MNNKEGALIVIVGPSGCGKGTIINAVRNSLSNIFLSISMTSRKPRVGEIDKESYYFVTKEEFLELVSKNEMLEYAIYVDNHYGTPKKFVLEHINKGESVILEIDSLGATQIKEKYPKAITIFIEPPSIEELKKRLINRNTDSLYVIDKRITKALEEMEYSKQCDYVIVNDVLEDAVMEVKEIIRKHTK